MFIEKKKLIQLVIFTVFMVTLIAPITNAQIKVDNVIIPDVVASNSPSWGSIDLKVQCSKPAGQEETLTIPIVVNGTTMTSVDFHMLANETIKSMPVNFDFPGATVLMINPLQKGDLDVKYEVKLDPFVNPISHVHYDIKIGAVEKTVALLVYPDWTFWAIVVDIVAVAATVFILRRAFAG